MTKKIRRRRAWKRAYLQRIQERINRAGEDAAWMYRDLVMLEIALIVEDRRRKDIRLWRDIQGRS